MNPRAIALCGLLGLVAAACGATRYFLEPQELADFMAAGPVVPELDREALVRAIPPPAPYAVDSGDLLEIRGPRLLLAKSTAANTDSDNTTHLARVDGGGNLQVPMLGAIAVRGKTLLQIEAGIADAAHPRLLVERPAIVARVVDYQCTPVTVVGAVEKPGVHDLRRDQLTLYGALTAAGGILKASNLVVGARRIRVRRPDAAGSADVVLPVKGLNVPFADVRLAGGETIEVERYEPDTFTVIGLVNKPGAHEYPPEVTYNLMQALAIAGGIDMTADPPYATVFRKAQDGRILPATFELRGNELVGTSAMPVKPGDVIVVEHTPASWSRSLLAQILRIQFGFFVDQRAGN